MPAINVKVVAGIANKIAESTGLNPTDVKRMSSACRTITYAELRKKGYITIPGVHLQLHKVGNVHVVLHGNSSINPWELVHGFTLAAPGPCAKYPRARFS